MSNALAVDLGSGTAGLWAAHRGTSGQASTSDGTLVSRGRVVDVDRCAGLLSELAGRYPEPVPGGGVVVVCRPVLSSESDQEETRKVIDAAFAPRRTIFIDTIRAAAIGAGAGAGNLLIADIGAQLTEVALLEDGRIAAARRTDIGTGDLRRGATIELIIDVVARHLDEIRAEAGFVTASARGLLLVGDGATHPELPGALASEVRLPVHRAAAPRTAALKGASKAAMSALRHPGLS
jgi:rod shape-determining protein MreB